MKKAERFKFTVDSNYLIAYLQQWNGNHEATVLDFTKRQAKGEQLFLIPHTLTEAYSVMTRLPEPYRITPALAFELLAGNFRKFPLLEYPAASDCWTYLAGMSDRCVGGGRSYDVWIARTAHLSGMNALVTWNSAHFLPNPFAGLAIVVP